MKKITALFLALALCLSLCTVTLAEPASASDFEVNYISPPPSLSINKYIGSGVNVEIPATLTYFETELPVTSIGNSAFYECASLTNVTIPNGVTSIGENAFENCKKLTSVTIPNSVTSIGRRAFYSCMKLTSVTIPNSVTDIGIGAFGNCTSLTSVTVEATTPPLVELVFFNSSALENIYVPAESVAAYKADANWNSYADKITAAPWQIGKTAGTDNVTAYLDDNGTLHIEGTGAMQDFTTALYTPWYASRTSITKVDIGSGVTNIGKSAFEVCKSLKSVMIPEGVTSIGESAFSECIALENVAIPNSVTSIGAGAFYYCTALESVTVDATTPPTLGTNVFSYCNALEAIYVPAESVAIYKSKSAISWLPYESKIEAISTYYNITIAETQHGTVTATPTDVASGTDVTLTVTPDNGYKLDSLTVTKKGGGTVTVTGNTFTMPADDVTVAATFAAKSTPHHHDDGGTTTPTVSAPKTADAGIALYGVLSVSSLLGMGWVSKKKR